MKRLIFFTIFLVSFNTKVFAIAVGNPSEPRLLDNGLFTKNSKIASFRAGYLYNYIYQGRFQNKTPTIMDLPSDVGLRVTSALLTLNIYSRVDISAILGTTNLEIDSMISTDRDFAYGGGLKAILFKAKRFDISLDAKYFAATLHPDFFIAENETIGTGVYSVVNNYEQKYEEAQASLSISYLTNFLIPYIGVTGFLSEISSTPKAVKLVLPAGGEVIVETPDSETTRNVGAVLGISAINTKQQLSLTIEGRYFDQNAFAFIGSLKF